MIYFAYGVDLNPARMVEKSPGYKSVGIARLIDYWISFPRYSPSERSAIISIVPHEGDIVWGALYSIPEEDTPILDHIFGFDPEGSPRLNQHVRRELCVQRQGRPGSLDVSTYVAVSDDGNSMPSPDYLRQIFDGARYHGLPRAYLGAIQAVRTVAG